MSKQNIRIVVGLAVGAAVIVALLLRPKAPVEADGGYREVMGTFARAVVVAPDTATADKCVEAAFGELRKVDALMSDYKSDSEISRVNRDACRQPVKVSAGTFKVLQKALYYSRLSDGAFDVTVGPLVDLWHAAAEANVPPTEARLQEAKAKVGYEKLILDANGSTVRFGSEGMRLDLGGIAKGYAIDRAVEAMQAGGALGGMVDVGGDIRCFGVPSRGKEYWIIGVQDPNRPEDWVGMGRTRVILRLRDEAIATSGDYRRFVLIDGKEYSHIVDTRTGRGSKAFSSVTIICGRAIDADALATAATVMGAERGLALIEGLADTEAILISPGPEFKIVETSGAGRFLK